MKHNDMTALITSAVPIIVVLELPEVSPAACFMLIARQTSDYSTTSVPSIPAWR